MKTEKLGDLPLHPTTVVFEDNELKQFQQVGNREFNYNGISQRLYIATMAMQGLCSRMANVPYAEIARQSFEYADELLKQENV